MVTKSPPFTRIVRLLHSLHCLPVKFRILFNISLFTYKALHEKQPVYLHSHFFHWYQTKELVCWSVGSRPRQAQELFTLMPHLLGTTCHCLSIQSFQLVPSRNIWRHISLNWPFHHWLLHTRWLVDVTELFHLFCCWTPIRLSRHCASFRREYWCYRNLID